ncbi:MAG: gamma-glutamyltransferase family protein [Litoreibacter sp.]|nr:gamma-glutamyltransferase family protein [Litoreibacter sp.]
MSFTTRPEIQGSFGVATSTHWIATAVGMGILERGGNAFDAAVAMGFTLHIVEPHLNGPMGDMPALICPAGAEAPTVICGQGVTPAGATIERYRDAGLDLIPGSGLLATVVPGAFGAWMLMLRDHGTMTIRDVLEPAIYYAEHGHPMLPRVAATIADLAEFFRTEWPTSAEIWLPGGQVPEAGALFCNPVLAKTWRRLLDEAESAKGRTAQIDAARDAFYKGFIAEAVDTYLKDACVMDAAGERRKGVLTGDDMANWKSSYETPLSVDYGDWTVWKCGAWTQGPTLLQSLRILEGTDIGELDPTGAEFVHLVTETMKLSLADREAYYGDPSHTEIPVEQLLSREHASQRRARLGPDASVAHRPGRIAGFEDWADAAISRAQGLSGYIADHPTEKKGDTVHLDVIDRWGNMVSATPSGGWLQSSPVIPGLGMSLNSRAQMFWLTEGLPTSLAPGRRPRTTLSPSMAGLGGIPNMPFGTPGGDQQDQWQLIFFLRHVHYGLNLQQAIDAPLFHTGHFQSSFYPREVNEGYLMIEPSFGTEVLETLRKKGHVVDPSEPWAIGRLTAARREPSGLLRAAATPRLMQAYAAGR